MTVGDVLQVIKKTAEEKGYHRIRFELPDNKNTRDEGIEILDLKTRAFNSLKAAKVNTIGDLYDRVSKTSDLEGIKNCGVTSRKEIMTKLLSYCIHLNIVAERPPLTGVTLS